MKPSDASEQRIFDAAWQMPDAQARAAYLAAVCAGDPDLRERVEKLLAANQRADEFLAGDPLGLGRRTTPPSGSEGPGTLIDKYKLLERLGEGGFGVVYMAEQTQPVKRRVALKIIKIGMDTREVVGRFEAERQALALMDHPNIAKVFDGGATETGRPYFVLELVRGMKLTDYCDEQSLPTQERLRLFIQVCQAVQHAHQKGIIHRDLKPSNILMTVNDGVAVPKIIDFGIAKATRIELTDKTVFTRFQQFLGTPAYMSPEQAELTSVDIDTRSDIYSLGVLLYELLTGKTPFDSKELLQAGLDEMRCTIREKEPPTPSTRVSTMRGDELTTTAKRRGLEPPKLVGQLRGDLDWIVMKCLEKDRARRYETANGLARDIQRHLNNEPVVASPPSKVYRLQKFIQRYRVTVAVTLVLGTVLIIGIVVSSLLAVRARRAEQDALLAQGNEARERSKAEQRLYDSLLGEVRALRIAHRVGYRDKAFQLLQQAKALNLPQNDFSDLKQEAVACLGDFIGLTPSTFSDFPPGTAISRAGLDRSGKLAVLGLTDGTILIRELPSGKQVAQLKTELPPRDFCFNTQGDQLVSINYLRPPVPAELRMQSSRIYIWGRTADNHWKMVDDIACPGAYETMPCGDALCVAVFSYHPREGRILDLKTKSVVQVFNFPDWGDEWGTPCATVSPDGRLLAVEILPASGLHDDEINVSDLKTGKLLKRLEPHRGDFSNLKFSPDSTELCCLSGDQGAVIYRISDFKPIAEFTGAFRPRSRPSFTHCDTIIAMPVGQQQNGIRLWDLIAREEIAILDEPEPAFEALFSNDERTLMTYGAASARTYQLDGVPEKLRFPGHAGVVPGIVFGPGGAWLASVGSDRKVKMWDCRAGGQNWVSEDLPSSGQSIASSPDGKLLAAGDSETRLISFFEMSTGKLVGRLGTNSTGWNRSTQFTADGRYFLTGGGEADYNERLDIWDLTPAAQEVSQTGVEARLITHLPINSWSLVVAPDSRTLAFVDNPGEPNLARFGGSHLYLWGINSTNPPRVLATNFIATSQSASFTPDSRRLLYADANRKVLTIDVASGREISRFSTLERGRTRTWTDFPNLCLSPDGTKLAMVSASSLGVDLWAAENGKLIFSLPEQNGASVCSLAWAPDSQRLAIGRANGNIAIWNLSEVNRTLDRLGLSSHP